MRSLSNHSPSNMVSREDHETPRQCTIRAAKSRPAEVVLLGLLCVDASEREIDIYHVQLDDGQPEYLTTAQLIDLFRSLTDPAAAESDWRTA